MSLHTCHSIMECTKQCNVAIFGIGRIGKIHLRHVIVSGRSHVKYLVDVKDTHEQIQSLTSFYHLTDVKILSPEDADEIFQDERLESVLICTPVQGRGDLIVKALQAGKHVFSEKPIALDESELSLCFEVAKQNKRILQCGFDKRFDVSVRKMYNQIQKGDLGDLRMIKLSARELPSTTNREYINSSGGIFIDTMIHEFDLLCWLAGEKPSCISAFGHANNQMFAECGDVDIAGVLVKFPSGLLGFVESCRGASYGYDQRFEVFGSKGVSIVENPKESHLQTWNETGVHGDVIWQETMTRYTDGYRKELEHFFDAIQGIVDCEVHGDEVIFVHRLCKAAGEALKSGKVVSLV